jgi:methionine aminotransferase
MFMSKLPNVGTSIFTIMSKLAIEHNAINLSQGFPNFPIDSQLVEILQKVAAGGNHQYAPMPGNTKLLNRVAQTIQQKYGRMVRPEAELLVTAGATQGIFATIQALVSAGEEVLILDPSYDCYEAPVILTGARPVRIPLAEDFSPDWERIHKSVSKNTRLLIINNPHNPSGRVLVAEDLVQLEKLVEQNPHLIILADEVYEFIYFEKKHLSLNTRPKLAERSVIVSSFGKTFHITGWKIGYLTAPEKYISEIKKVHQFLVFCVNSVAQETLAEYLEVVDFGELGKFYQDKRDLFRNLMIKSRFQFLPSEGSYFQLASYRNISEESDVEFCKRLVLEHGVAAIPLSVFNSDRRDQKLIRFCFAKTPETLKQAAERLCRI